VRFVKRVSDFPQLCHELSTASTALRIEQNPYFTARYAQFCPLIESDIVLGLEVGQWDVSDRGALLAKPEVPETPRAES
jgi:hypothetical protein